MGRDPVFSRINKSYGARRRPATGSLVPLADREGVGRPDEANNEPPEAGNGRVHVD